MKRIDNTTDMMKEPAHSLAFLAKSLGDPSSQILRMEADGQRQLCASQQLPTDGLPALLEAAPAITLIGQSDGDAIFSDVKLPDGWKVEPTDHAMYSVLKDDKGRKRASIFYKAAFYDRKAHIQVTRRFSVDRDYAIEDRNTFAYIVKDGETEVWRSRTVVLPEGDKTKWWEATSRIETELRAEAVAWLEPQYPDWQNAGAYWD